jgi:DNA-binding YbaB/EbfC family protein
MKGFGGMQQLMKQANQMQAKMKKLQEELSLREFEGTSGGGGVRVTAIGGNLIKSVTISPDVFSAGDVEMLQDMVASATNDALKNAKETVDKEMSKVTGGLNIPGMF